MRFYGIPSEERALEIVDAIKDGNWVYEESSHREVMDAQAVKEKLREIIKQVREWKENNRHIPAGTAFIFVHEPSDPKVFKIYDLSSLGCSPSLNPPRWKIYREELSGHISP